GYGLQALKINLASVQIFIAFASWIAAIVLVKSRSKILYLSESFNLLETTWNQSIAGKMLFDRVGDDLRLVKVNPMGSGIANYLIRPGELLCEKMPNHRNIVYPYNRPLIDLYLEVLETGEPQQFEFRYEGEVSGWYMNICVPISDHRLFITFIEISSLKDASFRDYLTGLYNRRFCQAEPGNWQSCLYIDLDRFKLINDQRGHQLGDRILMAVADVLRNCAHKQNGIAVREGGDEFLILLPTPRADEIAVSVLQDIQAIEIEGATISASIGIATTETIDDGHGELLDWLQQAAETAAREAKSDKRSNLPQNRIKRWNFDLDRRQSRRSAIEALLREPKVERECWLAYQPICNMQTGEIIGAEALLRWDSPKLGTVEPSEFIPIAEATGLIYKLSDWVLQHALPQLAYWSKIQPNFSVSINISPVELEEDDFPERIHDIIAKWEVPSRLVGIEITERGIYRNLDRYARSLQALQDMSVRLKVDDFGTGQSGLAQLLQFQFDEVKVDRAFIPQSSDDTHHLSICEAISALAKGLNFNLIAEGIEHLDQNTMLSELGYQFGQGYYFAKPMTCEQMTETIEKKVCLPKIRAASVLV
ncbi:MAG: bifunctional diguanylate cyclase/phosphodiesterase, partial [Geitlerinemataceae cyanobacterium]